MEEQNKKQKEKEYQHAYYMKTRDERRKKIECPVCKRMVCNEYFPKHQNKLICKKYAEK